MLGKALTALAVLSTLGAALPSQQYDYGALYGGRSTIERRDQTTFNYGSDKIRGVNIGGWLILEKFFVPSVFDATGDSRIVDEWTYGQYQDYDTAFNALTKHWDTFITEDDFVQIAAAGLNHVRIPIGFWSFDKADSEPYIQGALPYLTKAVGWAQKHGIKVIIDLHGAPGSQNGFDNSGHAGPEGWHSNWDNVGRTVYEINYLAAMYGTAEWEDTVTVLELLNEPTSTNADDYLDVLKQYYLTAYDSARHPWGPDGNETSFVVAIHDGFQQLSVWDNYMKEPQYHHVMIDNHYYHSFDQSYFQISADDHIQRVCEHGNDLDASPLWTFVGEWSLAVWECTGSSGDQFNAAANNTAAVNMTAPANQRRDGRPYIGTCDTDATNFDKDYPTFMRAFWDVQTQVFERHSQGWIFWTWKNEGPVVEWSYQAGIQYGYIPSTADQHVLAYSDLCPGFN